jgi:hypothetical protein
MESLLITVVEMPEFLAKARTFMGEETKALLINFQARNPERAIWSLEREASGNFDGQLKAAVKAVEQE